MSFSEAWRSLQATSAGATIPNWTVAKRMLPDSFRVVEAGPNFVEVESPGALNRQRIPRSDFEVAYDLWPRYLDRSVPRHEVRDRTRHSKYIISLYHWLAENAGGSLP